jgi:Fic-DOC domain mobile mystery protein B
MAVVTNSDGNTPLSPEELTDLIPSLATKEDLNEWERENILHAREWADKDRTSAADVVSDSYIRKLHEKMFDQTWKWAGKHRNTEKNIGVPFHEIREQLGGLVGDIKYWIDHQTYSVDEIAIRFHHRLVQIHLFPNGNGRHARLIADLLVTKLGQRSFTWGARDLVKPGEARTKYLEAIRAADGGDIKLLLTFARS